MVYYRADKVLSEYSQGVMGILENVLDLLGL